MTQQPSDYQVADPSGEPEGAAPLHGKEDDDTVEPKGDPADVQDQQLPPPGSDEDEALDLLVERSARSDGDRLV